MQYDKIGAVFVDRKEELSKLEQLYKYFKMGIVGGVLIYGLRRVGKTTLVEKFLEGKRSISINCAGLSTAKIFFLEILETAKLKFGLEKDAIYWEGWINRDYPEKMVFRKALEFINNAFGKFQNFIVFLDEFHLLLDSIARRVAREEKTNSERALLDLLWILKGVIEKRKVFWILSTSIGWEKLKEKLQLKHKESPLLAVFEFLEVKPLSREATEELIRKINPSLPQAIVDALADLSGGIPKLAIVLAINANEKDTGVNVALRVIRSGILDDVFDNLIRFASDLTKFSYNTILQVVNILSEGEKTVREISNRLGLSERIIGNILNELVKIGVVEKFGKKPLKYKLSYPLLASWAVIRMRDFPVEKKIEIAISELGLTVEAYIREILQAYEGKMIQLRDDKHGGILAGTTEEIKYTVKRVYSRRETNKFFSNIGVRNGDIVVEIDEDKLLIVEIKAGVKNLVRDEVIKFVKIVEEIKKNLDKEVEPLLIYYGEGSIELSAVSEAIKSGIKILTKKGIKLLAKKVEIPIV